MAIDDLRYDRTILAYHGCDAQVAESVLAGQAFRPSENAYDWLGTGVYFWEFGADRALRFAEWQLSRGKVRSPAVVGAVLQLGRCFDLTDTKTTRELRAAFSIFKRAQRQARQPLPKNRGPTRDRLLRDRDCAVINLYMGLLDGGGRGYDSVRCAFREGSPAFSGSAIYQETHIQIAVRNPACIVGVFRPKIEESS